MATAPPEGSPPGGGQIEQQIGKKATISLVCSILGCCCILSIVGIVFGMQAKSMIKQHNVGHQHAGKATAGIVIGCVWLVVLVVLNIIYALIGAAAAG